MTNCKPYKAILKANPLVMSPRLHCSKDHLHENKLKKDENDVRKTNMELKIADLLRRKSFVINHL